MSDRRPADSAASTSALFLAIFKIVFTLSQMSSFGTRPTRWASITPAPSVHLSPQPPRLTQQIQPPPNSSFPLMMASAPQLGQIRLPSRQRYFDSFELQEPSPCETGVPVSMDTTLQRIA